jgi:DNA-binding transcriptional ArsR family regulator
MKSDQDKNLLPCPTKPRIQDRSVLSEEQAEELQFLFKILSNRTRLKMIHALIREDSLCVTELAETVNMKSQAVSNQLQRLVDRGIVTSRRNGNNIYYRIVDPCIISLLDQGLCLVEDAKERLR